MEAGTVPWHKPWIGGEPPQNFLSRRQYAGVNAFLLNASGFASPFWLTFRQVKTINASIRKGEKAWPVVFWKILEVNDPDAERKNIPYLRYHSVFNIEQCENIKLLPKPDTKPFAPIDRCEEVLANMPQKPKIVQNGDRAAYYPHLDKVAMPDQVLFESPEFYYGALFHELVHSTGHASRLNRKEIVEPIHFGSDPYSREELVAEMGAAFLCGYCRIESATLQNSAGYIQNWLNRLKDDKKLVVHAAANAQKASDFILGKLQVEAELQRPTQEAA